MSCVRGSVTSFRGESNAAVWKKERKTTNQARRANFIGVGVRKAAAGEPHHHLPSFSSPYQLDFRRGLNFLGASWVLGVLWQLAAGSWGHLDTPAGSAGGRAGEGSKCARFWLVVG